MVPILLDMGVLTVADGDALMLYCEAYASWTTAMIDIKKNDG
jgi:phage terminase small subunit